MNRSLLVGLVAGALVVILLVAIMEGVGDPGPEPAAGEANEETSAAPDGVLHLKRRWRESKDAWTLAVRV